jgi:plasmid stabilization system protein ParE
VNVSFTDAARWQLQAAIESVRRRNRDEAKRFMEAIRPLLEDASALKSRGTPLPEFPDFPYREARVDGYRIFFRKEGGTLWIAGIWRAAIAQ